MEVTAPTQLSLERALSLHDSACTILDFNPERRGRNPVGSLEDLPMAKRIEHTLLKTNATKRDVEALCQEAVEAGFRSVCVLQRDIERCRELLKESEVLVVTVLNFPLAGSPKSMLESECEKAVSRGADEVDFVVDVRSLIENDLPKVMDHAASVVKAASGRTVKAILETGNLSAVQVIGGMATVEAAGVNYAKTSTGFGARGASVEDIRLMRTVCGDRMGIKASGGIKDKAWAEQLVEAGADLIGTSSGLDCV